MANTSVVACGQIWRAVSEIPDDARTLKLKKERPYLIVQPDIHNFKIGTYIAMPITTQNEKESIYKIPINCPQGPHKRFIPSYILTYKERILEETELLEYLGSVSQDVVKECIDKHYSYLKGEFNDFSSASDEAKTSEEIILTLNDDKRLDVLIGKDRQQLMELSNLYKKDKKLFMTQLNIKSNNFAVKVRDNIQYLLETQQLV